MSDSFEADIVVFGISHRMELVALLCAVTIFVFMLSSKLDSGPSKFCPHVRLMVSITFNLESMPAGSVTLVKEDSNIIDDPSDELQVISFSSSVSLVSSSPAPLAELNMGVSGEMLAIGEATIGSRAKSIDDPCLTISADKLKFDSFCTFVMFVDSLAVSPSSINRNANRLTCWIFNGLQSSPIFIHITLTNFSMKYLVMCKVYTDVGVLKYLYSHVCPPVCKIIHSLKLVDYLHVQATSNDIIITLTSSHDSSSSMYLQAEWKTV